MDPYAARDLALDLMKRHGLIGWSFAFDHAKRRFGTCRPGQKRITLSKTLAFLNPEPQVRETILHEIAHALTPGDAHGAKWRAACLAVGAKPVRCFDTTEVRIPPRRAARYEIGCKTCGWWADRHRRTRRKLVCRACRTPVIYREKRPLLPAQ
ncbi:MAG: SprT-like domain-containing protein [Planctomycetes bacterium]|nr:SprT-like domain-containing protein [Planctomycetota bacterium]